MTGTRSRGPALTTFLVLVGLLTVAATVGNLYIFFGHSAAIEAARSMYPAWALYSLAAIAVLRLLSVIAIWLWSRTGVVLYIALTVAAMPICLRIGQPLSWLSVVGIALLLFLIRKHWASMQWGLMANNSFKPKPLRGSA
jgi:hypothetical protein